jgi:hypothetical protein
MGGFKRSGLFGLFGLIGVVAVAIAVAVIASSSGSGEANPKGTMALIFGVIAVFVAILFVLQRADLEKVAGGDAKAVQRAVAEGGGKIENPTTMEEPQLWAALAVKPIDNEAIKARGSMWDAGRRSQKLAWVVPLLIGGPLIAIAAVYGSIRALAPGGEMDKGYEKVGLAMAPLGLEVTERPKVGIETREATTGRVGPRLHGALVLAGERYSRPVSVRIGSGETSPHSEVKVGVATPEFKAKSRDGKVRPGEDVPAPLAAALKAMPNSTRWKKLTVEGGPEGIVVTRKGGAQAEWLCDLWLAERLAEAAA